MPSQELSRRRQSPAPTPVRAASTGTDMSNEPSVVTQVRRFHAPYWRALSQGRDSGVPIEVWILDLRDSLASLFEQGYSPTDVGMMLGLTGERVRQYARRFALPNPPRHRARIWDKNQSRFIVLPETVGRRANRLAGEASRKAWAAKRHAHLSRVQERFWSQVTIPASEGCWIWQGNHYRLGTHAKATGYGTYRGWFVHRLSFLWANGFIPMGRRRGALVVAHTCDNGLCVNPDHLELMTHQENIQDSIRKGRFTAAIRKSHCIHGHDVRIPGARDKSGRCRECARRAARAYYATHRQKVSVR